MAAKKAKKTANVNAYMYEGQFDIGFDCVGEDQCKHARFYVEPPDPDDECSCRYNGTCNNFLARKEALELLRGGIDTALNELGI